MINRIDQRETNARSKTIFSIKVERHERYMYFTIPMNLSVAVEIFKPLEYFSKYRGYGGFIEYSMFAIGSSGFMLDDIQQGSTLQ